MLPLFLLLCLMPSGNAQGEEQSYSIPNCQELERRVEYADQHFREGFTAGSKTDRGRVYVGLGPPDDIANYSVITPNGTLPPFHGHLETWTYTNIPGIGNDIKIDFFEGNDTGIYKVRNEGPEYYQQIQDRIIQTLKTLPPEQGQSGKAK